MPLPSNGTLSLQGYSKPGENETITAPPKQAMIVRMSAETLDALERVPQPQMEVSFEENSVVCSLLSRLIYFYSIVVMGREYT